MTSKRLATAQKYLSHFATLNSHLLESILAENFIQEFAPASLNPPGPFDKKGFIKHSGSLRNIMNSFPVTAKEWIDSENENRVTVWATAQTEFRDDAKDDEISDKEWAYKGEYIFIFTMDETGEKIVRTIEFLDSKSTENLRVLMKRAKGNREKRVAIEGKK